MASIVESQRAFYGRLWRKHGNDPQSLAWRDRKTQVERYFRLSRVFDQVSGQFSVHEVGCGLGDFGDYLQSSFPHAVYSGTDICPEFINSCQQTYPGLEFFCQDFLEHDDNRKYDFLTLSGTLNPRLNAPLDQWERFTTAIIRKMFACCRSGIAVNFLSTFCDSDRMQPDLHYQDPWQITAWVVQDLSRFVELDWGGPLFEYTVRIYRPEHVSKLYPDPQFDRYFRNIDRACPPAHPAPAE